MRDNFEFQDLIAYLVACGLLLPIAGLVGRNSVWSVLVLLALFIPIPIYVARLRYGMPARIDTVFEKYAYIMLAVGLLFMVAIVMILALT